MRLIVVFVSCLAVFAPAQDVIVLKSGRALSGEILEDRGRDLRIRDFELGELKLDTTRVRWVLPRGVRSGALSAATATLAPQSPPSSYVRIKSGNDGKPAALETATTRWHHAESGTTLLLVSAVHIAEPEYFANLQRILDSTDVVLFEGVSASEKGEPLSPEELEKIDALTGLQLRLGKLLALDFQKDRVEYARDFWKNADVDFGTLGREMAARGVSLPTDSKFVRGLLKLALGLLGGEKGDVDPKKARLLRRQVGGMLAASDKLMARMGGVYDVLLIYRNDQAETVLQREIAAGRSGRWISLFYGAAHMPDFDQRLLKSGWICLGESWLSAWSL